MYTQLTSQSELDELVSSNFNRVGKTYMLRALKGFLLMMTVSEFGNTDVYFQLIMSLMR
jgi:hypothetical protein